MDSLLTWLGTVLGIVLGAAALLLAVSVVPGTWVSDHQAAYIFLLVLASLSLLIMLGVLLFAGGRCARFRWKVWRAARRPPQVVLTAVVTPGSVTGSRDFSFNTGRQPKRLIQTPGRPAGLRIRKPIEVNVWDVPFPVRRCGKTLFRVIEFRPDGFIIADEVRGLGIEGEVSYADPPPPREHPPLPHQGRDAQEADP